MALHVGFESISQNSFTNVYDKDVQYIKDFLRWFPNVVVGYICKESKDLGTQIAVVDRF